MFLFVLVWNMVLMGEGTNHFPLLESVNFTENNTDNASQTPNPPNPPKIKRKRNSPGKPDPNAEVLALSPEILLSTNRFVCEICLNGFAREQNLHLHMRGHNIHTELKRTSTKETRKKVYICPEPTCVHHHPSRALGDITGIKKHFSRKHLEKKFKCEKCPKVYALESDLMVHSKMCGTKDYRCDCGASFSRKNTFKAHKSFCETRDQTRIFANTITQRTPPPPPAHHQPPPPPHHQTLLPLYSFPPLPHQQNHLFFSNPNPMWDQTATNPNPMWDQTATNPNPLWDQTATNPNPMWDPPATNHSTIPFLQNADFVGSHTVGHVGSSSHFQGPFDQEDLTTWHNEDQLTRDFMCLTRDHCGNVHNGIMPYANMGLQEVLNFTETNDEGGAEFAFPVDPTW